MIEVEHARPADSAIPLAPAGTFAGDVGGRHESRIVPPGGWQAPSPAQRKQLEDGVPPVGRADRPGADRPVTSEEAAALVHADSAALMVRSVEGPRVLWQQPGGPDPSDIWGPATLGALLGVGVAVREVLDGDPLQAGAALAEVARLGRSVAPGTDPVTGFAPRDRLPEDLRSALRAANSTGCRWP